MTEIAALLWPTAMFALAASVVVGLSFVTLWWFVQRRHRRVRDLGLMRDPAHALRRRLEIVNHRIVGASIGLALALFFWAVFYPGTITATPGFWDTAILMGAGVVALGWFAQELTRFWPERVGLLHAIEAQTRTGISLNLLMRQKYWVFHDVHIGGFRINHLVIGPHGVFCVDTVGRRVFGRLGLTGRRPPPKAEVVFDGQALRFPGWQESEVLDDAEAQAEWLGPWLASRVGEPVENVPTHAAIALPGWQVTSTHWKRMIVFNPSTPNMLVQGAPEGRRIDTTTSQALLKVLQQNREDIPDARLRNELSPPEAIGRGLARLLGRPV